MIIFYTTAVERVGMPRYELVGRMVLKAKDLKEAFEKLAEHFKTLAGGHPSDLPEVGTDLQIRREDTDSGEEVGLISTIPPPPRVPKFGGKDGE